MAVKLNSKGKTHAHSLVDSGKVDKTSSWSFTAEDGDKILGDPPDWNEYGKWFLGADDAEDPKAKAHWKYPFGKDGKLYRSGLIAIRQRAGQQSETEIYNAAGALIDKIDNKSSNFSRKSYNRSPFKPRAHADFKIVNKDEEATIYLYDEISWFGISAEQFVKDLNDIKAGTIHLRINSPGGSVFDGTALYNAIKQHKAKVITHVDGLAASIASVIALAGDEVRMGENAFFMIHEPWSMVIGGADTMREEADLLDKVGGTIAKIYSDKSGKPLQEILDFMASETWFTARDALDNGLIDTIENSKGEKARATLFDLSIFANVPEQLKENKQLPTARDLERILRDAGCSAKQAKVILAEGYSDDLRDEDVDPVIIPAPNVQRDAEQTKATKRDRVSDLLIRAEMAAPSH